MSLESVAARSDSSDHPVGDGNDGQSRMWALGAALADQGAQSLVNLVLSVAAARALPTEDFGRFSIAFIALTVLWGFLRALVTEPFIVEYAARPSTAIATQLSSLTGLLLRVAGPFSLVALIAAAATDGMWRTSALFFAVVIPLIVVLEAERSINLAAKLHRSLLAIGSLWVLPFTVLALVLTVRSSDVLPILVAYVAVTAFAAVVGGLQIRRRSLAAIAAKAESEGEDLDQRLLLRRGAPLSVEFLVTAAGVNLLVIVVALVAGLDQSAGLRGAMVLGGPITTLMGGLRLGTLADATRYRSQFGDERWASYALRLSAGLLMLGAAGAGAIAVLAQRYGSVLLGDTWRLTEPALLPFLLAAVLTATHLTAASILRARDLGERALFIRMVTTPTAIVPAVIGATINGAAGASLGFLIGVVIAAPIWLQAATRLDNP